MHATHLKTPNVAAGEVAALQQPCKHRHGHRNSVFIVTAKSDVILATALRVSAHAIVRCLKVSGSHTQIGCVVVKCEDANIFDSVTALC